MTYELIPIPIRHTCPDCGWRPEMYPKKSATLRCPVDGVAFRIMILPKEPDGTEIDINTDSVGLP